MKPKPQSRDDFELFQAHFDQILNRNHPLVQLADKIDGSRFDAVFADSYSQDMGAPAKAVRLMVGLQYLKYMFNESDESVVDRWAENVYWQYFCGFTHMQHEACPSRKPHPEINPRRDELKSFDYSCQESFQYDGLETMKEITSQEMR